MSMRIIEWDSLVSGHNSLPKAAMTIGVFDGLHLGHRALIKTVVNHAPQYSPTVVTFMENPKARIPSRAFNGDILTLERKLELLEANCIEQVILIDFSENFSKLTGKEFIDLLKNRGNLRYLTIGQNFRCGYGLDTDAQALKKMNEADGIRTELMTSVCINGSPVSSSRIRTAIAAGDLVEAAALLGRNVEIDLRKVPTTPGPDLIFYHVDAVARMTPPQGRYSVLVYGSVDISEETEAEIRDGIISLPSRYSDSKRIEFLT